MSKAYAALAALLLLVISSASSYLYGQHTQADHDKAKQLASIEKNDQQVGHANTLTTTHTLAAVTHDQAIGVNREALQHRIQTFHPITPVSGGRHVAAPSTHPIPVCADPFADPAFRVLYDAGSVAAGAPVQAGGVLPPGT
jgi:hypothetical protein